MLYPKNRYPKQKHKNKKQEQRPGLLSQHSIPSLNVVGHNTASEELKLLHTL
jgi:hypothetical protein